MKKIRFSLRIEKELYESLKEASSGPIDPTMTAIVELGIRLALKELEARKAWKQNEPT